MCTTNSAPNSSVIEKIEKNKIHRPDEIPENPDRIPKKIPKNPLKPTI